MKSSLEGRFMACQGCREQKIRCIVKDDQPTRCVRCRKVGLDCIRVASYRRKSKTKATIQRELDQLKQQVHSPIEVSQAMPSTVPMTSPANTWVAKPSDLVEFLQQPPSTTLALSTAPSFEVNGLLAMSRRENSDTVPRALNGQEIDIKRIDDCFALFFENYAPLLPILDPGLCPNSCYAQCPFLFWTILLIGSRRYPKDPTMLGRLSPHIINLAFTSLSSRAAPIQVIQGLLLLCTWPVPVTSMSKDVVHVLSGAVMHLAMQIGLHIPGIGQDFVANRLSPNPAEKAFRARLWLLCLVTCQSVSYMEGLPPTITYDSLDNGWYQTDKSSVPSTDLLALDKLQRVLASSMTAMLHNGLMLDPMLPGKVLNSLIRVFDNQVMVLKSECREQLNMIYFNSARLHINTFYFFEHRGGLNMEGLTELYIIACSVIDSITTFFETINPSGSCTAYFHRTMILAAFTILKISKCHIAPLLDLKDGEKSYFATIVFLRKSSLENDDLYARGAMILTQLWTSDKIFKKADGMTDSLSLRIRTRLTMSVVFDCFWWWREEFQGKSSPFKGVEEQDNEEDHERDSSVAVYETQQQECDFPALNQDIFVTSFADNRFPDYDWAASLDLQPGGWEFPGLGE